MRASAADCARGCTHSPFTQHMDGVLCGSQTAASPSPSPSQSTCPRNKNEERGTGPVRKDHTDAEMGERGESVRCSGACTLRHRSRHTGQRALGIAGRALHIVFVYDGSSGRSSREHFGCNSCSAPWPYGRREEEGNGGWWWGAAAITRRSRYLGL